ncbi:HEAT repeat [Chlamydia serpentis]|uniref:HEAT repeat n=1 Tax=Chlamydia serpentis TaxID=1967782 RepID=A0A2R8FAZ9_9CHLA|nr:HEAT repeat [Chlamydia serpentis]
MASDSLRYQLLIQDFTKASAEALCLLESEEYSIVQAKLILKALTKNSSFDDWFASFKKCQLVYPNLACDRDVLEEFAIQVLCKGVNNSSSTVRAVTVLAIGLARDFRLVPLLLQIFSDDSPIVRSLALQVAVNYGSESLKKAIAEVARNDESLHVRITAYRVIAHLRIEELLPFLRERAENKLVDGVERREAWKASLEFSSAFLHAPLPKNDIDRALFTCQVLRSGSYPEESCIFTDLLSVEYPEVQEALLLAALACNRWLPLSDADFLSKVRHIALSSPFPKVRFQAAALLHLHGEPLGCNSLVEGLRSPLAPICEAASAALCSLGIHGVPLAKEHLGMIASRKAAANLAILLLVNREDIEKAGDVIARYLFNPEMCWAIEHFLWDAQCNFRGESLPLYSDMIKREIGRKLIRLLAVARYSQVKAVTATFLSGQQTQGWSFFSGIFWEEGDPETSADLVTDACFAAKLEGALASLCQKKDRQSLEKVFELYIDSRWQDKLAILESVAFSENLDAIPFLLECCCNEAPSLQSAAAGALFAIFK